jgi:hypothetical protein
MRGLPKFNRAARIIKQVFASLEIIQNQEFQFLITQASLIYVPVALLAWLIVYSRIANIHRSSGAPLSVHAAFTP